MAGAPQLPDIGDGYRVEREIGQGGLRRPEVQALLREIDWMLPNAR
ncbi:MAG: hypothetical protein R2910_09410 [Gemmatimonadales bacterium]